MIRRAIAYAALMTVLFLGFHPRSHATTPNPAPEVNQPDQVLLERALQAMKNKQYAAARSLLEGLIEGYPDSDYVPRAKLSIGDAWYAEGALQRAEMEYQDFVTFFPNRPEVAAARKKIESIQKKAEK